MKYSELTRHLRRLGARGIGELGRHERWIRTEGDTVYRTVIPRHHTQEVPTGTLHRIRRTSTLVWRIFVRPTPPGRRH